MSLYGLFQGTGPTGFGYNSTSDQVTEDQDIKGKTFLLTGCNAGLGKDTLRVLTARGARVIATARTEDKAKEAIAGRDAVPLACELSEPESVRAAVQRVRSLGLPLDGVIANAGVMALPERHVKHNLELQFLTNHIGHFLLVTGLLDQLTDTGRVVMLSSNAHNRTYPEGVRFDDLAAEKDYTPWSAYGQSKLSNLLFARLLSRRLKPGQTANSVHPGVIATELTRHMGAVTQTLMKSLGPILVLKSIPQGSATQCFLATHRDAAKIRGEYCADCNVATPSAHGQDDALAEALWTKTEEIVAALP